MGEIRTAVKMDPHQKKALAKLQDGNILWGGVGSGKSRVALAYYMLTEAHEDVYVITTAKKRDSMDWETEAARFGIGKERNATMAGVLTIDSWNNLHKYVDVKDQFFIFDEQRLVGNGKWTKSFLKIAKKNRWILLSATPGDTWMDYIPVMIANGFYRNRTEFKHEHVIYAPFSKYPKVERYVNVQRLVRQRNQILIHMPYPKETKRHPVNVWCEFDEITMARVSHGRWNIFEDKPIRDIADLFHQMRKVTNTDPSRLGAVWKLLAEHPRLIIFYNFDYELDHPANAEGVGNRLCLRRMERPQASSDSRDGQMDLRRAIHRRRRRLELHDHQCRVLLEPHLLVQVVGAGPWPYRSDQYSVRRSVLLHPALQGSDRLGHLEVAQE